MKVGFVSIKIENNEIIFTSNEYLLNKMFSIFSIVNYGFFDCCQKS